MHIYIKHRSRNECIQYSYDQYNLSHARYSARWFNVFPWNDFHPHTHEASLRQHSSVENHRFCTHVPHTRDPPFSSFEELSYYGRSIDHDPRQNESNTSATMKSYLTQVGALNMCVCVYMQQSRFHYAIVAH